MNVIRLVALLIMVQCLMNEISNGSGSSFYQLSVTQCLLIKIEVSSCDSLETDVWHGWQWPSVSGRYVWCLPCGGECSLVLCVCSGMAGGVSSELSRDSGGWGESGQVGVECTIDTVSTTGLSRDTPWQNTVMFLPNSVPWFKMRIVWDTGGLAPLFLVTFLMSQSSVGAKKNEHCK